MVAPVSDRMAKAIEANPTSLRLGAQAEDGVYFVERPDERRPRSQVVVVEVDEEGRPKLVGQWEPTTNGFGTVRWEGGYGPPTPGTKAEEIRAGARHEYNPLDALRGRDDD